MAKKKSTREQVHEDLAKMREQGFGSNISFDQYSPGQAEYFRTRQELEEEEERRRQEALASSYAQPYAGQGNSYQDQAGTMAEQQGRARAMAEQSKVEQQKYWNSVINAADKGKQSSQDRANTLEEAVARGFNNLNAQQRQADLESKRNGGVGFDQDAIMSAFDGVGTDVQNKLYEGVQAANAGRFGKSEKIFDQIKSEQGWDDDTLNSYIDNTYKLYAHDNEEGKLTSGEAVEYAGGKISQLSSDDQKLINDWTRDMQYISSQKMQITNANKTGDDRLLTKNEMREYETSMDEKYTQTLKDRGWTDRQIDEYKTYAQRVANKQAADEYNSNFDIDPEMSGFGKFIKSKANTKYALNPLRAVGGGIMGMVENSNRDVWSGTPIDIAKNLFTGAGRDTDYGLGRDVNDPLMSLQRSSDYAQEQVVENAIGDAHPFGQQAYQIGMSTAQSAENMAAALALGAAGVPQAAAEAASLAPFFASSYNSMYEDARERGATESESQTLGILAGSIEAGTELFGLENLWGLADGSRAAQNLLVNLISQAVFEGSEEGVGDILNRVADWVVLGDDGKNKVSLTIDAYTDQFMREDPSLKESEARKMAEEAAHRDFWKETGLDTLSGAISGFIMGAGGTALGYANASMMKQKANQISENYNTLSETVQPESVQEQYRKYAENPYQKMADDIAIPDEVIGEARERLEESKENLQKIADRVDNNQKVTASDRAVASQAVKIADKILEGVNEYEQKGLEKGRNMIPEEYRDKSSDITEDDARTLLGKYAAQGDEQGLIDTYQQMRTSTDRNVRNNADSILEDYMGFAGYHGVDTDAVRAGKVSAQEAYEAGVQGKEIEAMSDAARAAYNAGAKKRIEIGRHVVDEASTLKSKVITSMGEVTLEGKFNAEGKVETKTGAIPVEDIQDTGSVKQAYTNAAAQKTLNAKNAYLANIKDQTNLHQYDYAFKTFYRAGETGVSFDDATHNGYSKVVADIIGTETARGIYEAGVADRMVQLEKEASAGVGKAFKIKKGIGSFQDIRSNASSNINTDFMKLVAKMTGLDVVLTDKNSSGQQAMFEPGQSRITVTEDHASQLIHEMAEFVEFYNSEAYEKIRSAAMQASAKMLGSDRYQAVLDGYHKVYQQINADQTALESSGEMANDFLVSIMNTKEGQKALAEYMVDQYGIKEAKSLGEKVKDFFKGVVDSMKSMLSSSTLNSYQRKALESKIDETEAIARDFVAALDGAIKNYQATDERKTGEFPGVKNSITINSTDEERYEELKDRIISIPSCDNTRIGEDINKLKEESLGEARKTIYSLAEKLGITRKGYTTPDIDIEFEMSKRNLKESVDKQFGIELPGRSSKFAELLTCLNDVIKCAHLIEVHSERYEGENREDPDLRQFFILTSAFMDKDGINPVKLGIKDFIKKGGRLYVSIVVPTIETTRINRAESGNNTLDHTLRESLSNYRLADILTAVKDNPASESLGKYIPDQFATKVKYSLNVDDSRVFYTRNGVEVVQNPTSSEYTQMREDILKQVPWLRGTDEILLRYTYDEEGNKYYWAANEGIHAQIEPEINRHYNTRTSQHYEWWTREDKDDYPIDYSNRYSLDVGSQYVDQYGNVIPVVDKTYIGSDFIKDADAVFKAIRTQIRSLKGQNVVIKSSDQEIFFDGTSASEYTGSEDTKGLFRDTKAAKMNAAAAIRDIVENAKNRKHKPNKKDVKNADASRGVDYYKAEFAIKNDNGTFTLYGGSVLIREDKNGTDYFYDLVEPRIKKGEVTLFNTDSSLAQNASAPTISEKNVSQGKGNVKYSLDTEGRELSSEQQEYFKDSKMRDETGALKVMYHGARGAGFTVFDHDRSDDGHSFFFTDSLTVAKTYSGTKEIFSPDKQMSFEELDSAMQGYTNGELYLKKDGKDIVVMEVGMDEDQEVYRGDLKGAQRHFIDSIKDEYHNTDANYQVYLNITNPLIVDAKGSRWDELPEGAWKYHYGDVDITNASGDYEYEAEWQDINTGTWEHEAFKTLADMEKKFGKIYEIAEIDNSGEMFINDIYVDKNGKRIPTNTRLYADIALEQGHDGVIFKNMVDTGLYASSSEEVPSTVAVVFGSNQIKSVDNVSPTENDDIRFSLSVDSEGRELSEAQQKYFEHSKIRDELGKLKVMFHGSREIFTEFKPLLFGGANGTAEGYGIYLSDSREVSEAYGSEVIEAYANVTHPADINGHTITEKKLIDLIRATCKKEAQQLVDNGDYDSIQDAIKDTWVSNYVYTYDKSMDQAYKEAAKQIMQLNSNDFNIVQEVMGGLSIRDYEGAYDFYDTLTKVTGIDGFITEWYDAKGGKSSQVVLAFDSNQIKNVDNTAPTNDPDIRYSMWTGDDFFSSLTEDEDSVWTEEQSKELGSILEDGMKALKNQKVDSKICRNIATKLRNEVGSEIQIGQFADMIEKAFAYLQTGEHVNYDDTMRIFEEIARPVIDECKNYVGEDEYKDFINKMKTYKIKLNDQQLAEVRNTFGSYAEFKKAMYPLNFSLNGHSLDSLWGEICDSYGYLLDIDTTDADEPLALFDALSAMRPTPITEFGGNADEVGKDLAMRIVEEYLEAQSDAKAKDAVAAIRARQKDFRAQVKSLYNERLKEAKQQLTEKMRHNVAQADMNARWREAALKAKQAEQIDALREQNRERVAEVREAERSKAAERDYNRLQQIAEIRARNRQQAMQSRERRAARYEREQIEKHAKNLVKWIAEPTEKHHVLSEMQAPILEFLKALDFVDPDIKQGENGKYYTRVFVGTKYENGEKHLEYQTISGDTKEEVRRRYLAAIGAGAGGVNTKSWIDRMNLIRDLYGKIDNVDSASDELRDFIGKLSPDLADQLADVVARNGDVLSTSQLSSKDLRVLKNVLSNIVTAVNQGNKAFTMKEEITQLHNETLKEAAKMKNRKHSEMRDNFNKVMRINMATPRTYFTLLGEAGDSIYKALREGLNTKIRDIKKAADFMEEVTQGISKKDLRKMAETYHEFHVYDGTIRLTETQMMSLYETVKREGAMDRIRGGIRADKFKVTEHGIPKTMMQDRAYHVSEQDIMNICNALTDEQKALADKLQQYLATECSKDGNEVSMKLYGYEKYIDPTYFPYSVDQTTVDSTNRSEGAESLTGIERAGFTNALREGANNPLLIKDIFDVFTDHVAEMAAYHGYAAPIKDCLRWMNYKTRTTNDATGYTDIETTKSAINKLCGVDDLNNGGVKYLTQLIKDINGQEKSQYLGNLTDMLMSHYKAAAVGANLRVVLQQGTAYFRALNTVDPKYLMYTTLHPIESLKNRKIANELSPIMWWKSQGYYETSIGKSLKEIITGQASITDKMTNAMMSLAGVADDVTWGALYTAIEAEQRDKTKGMNLSEEEFRARVNERFDEMVDQTQVVDSTLHRSQYMRSKDNLNKIQTAFMAEPIKSYNMLMEAIVKDIRDGSMKRTARATTAFVLTAIATSAFAAIADAFRYTGDDDDWSDKYLEYLKKNIADNVNPFNLVPVLKEVVSAFGDGKYSTPSRLDMEFFSTLKNAWKVTEGLVNGENAKTGYGVYMTYAKLLSQATGVPIYNASRDLAAMYNTLITDHNLVTGQAPKKYEAVMTAIENGASAEEIKEILNKSMDNEGVIYNVRSKITSAYKQAYFEAIDEEDEEAAEKIANKVAEGMAATGMSDEEIEMLLDEWADPSYGYSILDKAIESGEGIEDAVDTLINIAEKKPDKVINHILNKYGSTVDYDRENNIDSEIDDRVELALSLVQEGISYDEAMQAAAEAEAEKAEKAEVSAAKTEAKENLFDTINSGQGDYKESVQAAVDAGMEYKDVKSALTSEYKPLLVEQYKDEGASAVQQNMNRIAMIKAYCDEQSGLEIPKKYNGDYYKYEYDQLLKWFSEE